MLSNETKDLLKLKILNIGKTLNAISQGKANPVFDYTHTGIECIDNVLMYCLAAIDGVPVGSDARWRWLGEKAYDIKSYDLMLNFEYNDDDYDIDLAGSGNNFSLIISSPQKIDLDIFYLLVQNLHTNM